MMKNYVLVTELSSWHMVDDQVMFAILFISV